MVTQSNSDSFVQYYPDLTIDRIKNPSLVYALPVIGFLIKLVILIPVFFLLMIFSIVTGILVALVNPFYVLFRGVYWDTAYQFTMNLMNYSVKTGFFFSGLTDTYPGFDWSAKGEATIVMPKPAKPSALYAIPILGLLIRGFLMIPYLIWSQILQSAIFFALVASSVVVLFRNNYPESAYEFIRDSMRIQLGSWAYFSGLSEKYPSFSISMNHKGVKILLIILGVLSMFMRSNGNSTRNTNRYKYPSNYNQNQYNPNQYIPPTQ